MKSLFITRALRLTGLFFMFAVLPVQAQVCRVSVNGTDQASGASWQQTKSLVGALTNPQSCSEIWVKSGTYLPTAGLQRTTSFSVQPGVKLYGGFYGTETSLTQRDYLYNKPVLSGDIGLSGVLNDNSYQVLSLYGTANDPITQTTVIDGFIIEKGNANNMASGYGRGGGLYCSANESNSVCSPLLQNLVFRENHAVQGGALFSYAYFGDSSPVIHNVNFIANTAQEYGGAVANFSFFSASRVSPEYQLVNFTDNVAQGVGGALHVKAAGSSSNDPVMNMVTFSGNEAASGGAVSTDGSQGFVELELNNVTFHNNSSQGKGGAIHNKGQDALIRLNHATIEGNQASTAGGGIHVENSQIEISNSILWNNQAPSGNQLFSESAQVVVTSSVIQSDCAGFGGSGSGSQNCQNTFTGNPLLGSLQNNRGFTNTMLPGVGSSALDNGDNSTCLSADQRGIARPQNGQCDIGAVEVLSTCRVTTTGSQVGNGSNWAGQAMDLQTALSAPNCHQVWIKKGTYTPTTGSDRSASFIIQPGVTVLGGFAGTENSPNDRDVPNNLVILSGDIGVSNDMTDNSYHVVTINGNQGTPVYASTVLADFDIRYGYGSAGVFDFPNNSGAGLFCDGSGPGGVCNPYLSNITFSNNQATGGSGGAMFNNADNDGKSNPQLVNVNFVENQAINGGAMYNHGSMGGTSSPLIVNGWFINNTATASGGGIYNNANGGYSRTQMIFGYMGGNWADYGGAIYSAGQFQGINTTSLNQVNISHNLAFQDGGGFYTAGWNGGQSKPTIHNALFEGNLATRGGAMFINDLAGNGSAEVSGATFASNQATDGGAIFNDGENGFSHPSFTNVTFHGNSATQSGGAMYNNGNSGASSPSITNATFSGNTADYGAAIYSSGEFNGSASPVFRHTIMWGNVATTSGDTIHHNIAESHIHDSVFEYGCPTVGAGNAVCNNLNDSNPMLGPLADNGGFTLTMLPAANSPAINGGDNGYCPGEDQRGVARPNAGVCDIGAVEVVTQLPHDLIFKDGFD